ncbi:MAG TPA: carbohydrate ABC transporter permease [Candidatus Acidoferrales bacterium]|nr:carbohydrate ABC transporter permease [Candidatus Acidoferrales bacterium]
MIGRAWIQRRRPAARQGQAVLWNALAALVFLVMVFPIYWMIATSFKSGRDILSLTPQWFPIHPTLANYEDAWHKPFFLNAVLNSVQVVGTTVLITLALAFLAAVAIARYNFGGRKAFIVLVIGVQMVPLNALIIPIYLLLDGAGQTDRLPGVVVTYLAFVLPFVIWTLRGFIANVPIDLEEQAMIDGCSRGGAFLRILLPLVAPGLVATAIYAFIQAWNEYIVAYVLLPTNENQTLTVWLAGFTTNHGPQWGPLMAAATLTSLPVVAFFIVIQKRVVANLSAGAVKG